MTDHIGEATKKVIDLDALEKLADEATPGEWEPVSLSGYGSPFSIRMAYQSDNPNASKTHYGIQSVRTRGDAHFIAAANPATIKALIAELKEARVVMTRIGFTEAGQDGLSLEQCIDAARAFLARNGKGEG